MAEDLSYSLKVLYFAFWIKYFTGVSEPLKVFEQSVAKFPYTPVV